MAITSNLIVLFVSKVHLRPKGHSYQSSHCTMLVHHFGNVTSFLNGSTYLNFYSFIHRTKQDAHSHPTSHLCLLNSFILFCKQPKKNYSKDLKDVTLPTVSSGHLCIAQTCLKIIIVQVCKCAVSLLYLTGSFLRITTDYCYFSIMQYDVM